VTPSEIAKEAAERIKWVHKDAEWQNNVTYVVEAAIEKAMDLPDERWVAQQLFHSSAMLEELQKQQSEDTKRLDWLEENVADLLCRAESGEVVWLVYANLVEVGRGATPRAALAAAMKGEA